MTDSDPPESSFDPVERVAASEGTIECAPPAGKVRIEDVAAIAGVSPITVSRALRNPGIVSEVRRKRIEAAVAKTGYASNPHASALKSGRSNIVAAFLSNIASEQYTAAAAGCSAILEPAGYHLVMSRTSYSYSRETALIRAIMGMRPAAAFITGVMELEENRIFLRGLHIPIVESWAYAADPIDMLVGFSNVDGVKLAATHLAERGYRKIGLIGRDGGRGTIRRRAFEREAMRLGLDTTAVVAVSNVNGVVDGRQALRDILARAADLDAVFCANDLLGIGVMLEARAMGLRIPEDLAIVGFGDSELAAQIPPGMTTISADSQAMGVAAGRLILARLNGEDPSEPSRIFKVSLAVRGST